MEKLLSKIGEFFQHLWVGIEEFFVTDLKIVLNVAQSIYTAVNNPVVQFAFTLIPGAIGEIVRQNEAKYMTILGQAIDVMFGIQVQGTVQEKITYLVEYIKGLPVAQQHSIIQKLASILLMILDGGEEPESSYDASIQMAFTKLKMDDGGGQPAKLTYNIIKAS